MVTLAGIQKKFDQEENTILQASALYSYSRCKNCFFNEPLLLIYLQKTAHFSTDTGSIVGMSGITSYKLQALFFLLNTLSSVEHPPI